MHIVHLIARLNDGGPARVLASLGRTLVARGHRLTVLAGECAADEADMTLAVRASGVEVETIPGLARRLAPFADLCAFAHLHGRLRRLAPDVVHTHTAKAGALGRTACRLLGLTCLHTYHGHVLEGYFPLPAELALRVGERLLAGNCHHQALPPGQFRELHDRFRIGRRARWHVLPVPVEPVQAQPAAWHERLKRGVPVIGFLGRLAAIKDVRLWLDAFAVLHRQRAVQGLVCGDGAERAALAAHATAAGLPVLFTGTVPAGEALAVMDVLLMSSRNEGLPLVAPAVGGLRDLIGWGAVTGADRTPTALAAACVRVLDHPDLTRPRAKALARRLRPESLAPAYEALYRALTRGDG